MTIVDPIPCYNEVCFKRGAFTSNALLELNLEIQFLSNKRPARALTRLCKKGSLIRTFNARIHTKKEVDNGL